MQRSFVWVQRNSASLLLLLASTAGAGGGGLEHAEQLYQSTNYGAAIEMLLASSPETAERNALLGKSYFMQGQFKSATVYLQKAVAGEPSNADYRDWLGKAYGRRAEHSNPLTALPLAIKTRECFEKAVVLNPTSMEALGDLFEFYLEAPGVVGGGTEKAEMIAARISRLSAAESHYVHARLAEKHKDTREAEIEYRKAMEAAPHDVGRVIDLGAFLSNQGRYRESDEVFELASQVEPASPKVMFAHASAYIQSNRNLPEAKILLQRYAALPHTPDDPPQSEVARLAAKLR